ncbi:hypothetical protein ACN26Y_18000 [Micromonospora sp. WMMD558]|uniref:hypothetical protein n=1 Tax=Micromonospora sp. WMMD558 TaxID=3403462 RepID=UPI003BF47088
MAGGHETDDRSEFLTFGQTPVPLASEARSKVWSPTAHATKNIDRNQLLVVPAGDLELPDDE